jgi:prolyl oligopeptidase
MSRTTWSFASLLLTLALVSTITAMDKPSYPATPKNDVKDQLHGIEIADPYRWLENADDAKVKAWVEEENKFTRGILDKIPGRDKVRERLNQLLDIGSIGTPTPRKGKYFYTRRDGKQNQPVLYVREGVKGEDRVLLDPNTLSKEGTTALDWWFPSRDGSLLAYGLSQNGSEQSTLYIRDVASGKDRDDKIDRTRYCSVAWMPDNKGFFYTRNPKPGTVKKGEENYHKHVFFHKLGDDPDQDIKVFGEGRPAEDMPSVSVSPDGRWVVVTEHQGWAKSEVFFGDWMEKKFGFRALVENVNAVHDVFVRNDRFYVRTNDKAPRYKLMRVDPLKPERENWKELLAETKDVLDGTSLIGDTLVAEYMHQATSSLKLFDRDGKPIGTEVKLPTLGTIAGLGGEWDGSELFFGFQSFTMPPSIYRLDLAKKEEQKAELWGAVKADIDFDQYEVEQVKYPSKDGTEITMFLAHKKGVKGDGKTPTLLYGYGGFNISLTPMFSASRFLFLERGGIIAIPNLRGGGEYGEEWHQAGMLGKKQNVFDDFIAAAKWLLRERRCTDREHLAIQGGSNGGLLVGAALTQRPEMFRAVVCAVPLLDMVRYHKFLIARLWIPEYGSADDADQFKWLYAYSPYHRVKDGTAYPAVLLEAAESDSRVDALHARKMAARLQAATSSVQPILLRLETKAGHGAGKPRAKVLDELTDTYSFLFWQLGVKVE